jgi:8-oxo-dGTP diphosphatase
MSFDTARPYIASYMILRRDGKIAFVLRQNTAWMNGYYGLPAGKVEHNESFTSAAMREAKEEAGVEVRNTGIKHALTVHRNDPESDVHFWVDVYFEVVDWEGEPHNAEPHMHAELTWLDPNNLPENIIPGVKFAIEQIQAGTTYAEYGWS